MKAIETRYKGYRFRSRLEARWAVYFDADGIEWEYEREGFDLGAAGPYLPDFWLPRVRMWAEVKPDRFSSAELEKCHALADATGHPVLLLDGLPDFRSYFAVGAPFVGRREYIDFVVSRSGDDYYESERRFFACPGDADWPEPACVDWVNAKSIDAALGARFEHGESGAPEREIERRPHLTDVRLPAEARDLLLQAHRLGVQKHDVRYAIQLCALGDPAWRTELERVVVARGGRV